MNSDSKERQMGSDTILSRSHLRKDIFSENLLKPLPTGGFLNTNIVIHITILQIYKKFPSEDEHSIMSDSFGILENYLET